QARGRFRNSPATRYPHVQRAVRAMKNPGPAEGISAFGGSARSSFPNLPARQSGMPPKWSVAVSF
ncbi:MAG: hypothetical protein ACKPJJ_03945, partial [Planctomycetaceae bacterium]